MSTIQFLVLLITWLSTARSAVSIDVTVSTDAYTHTVPADTIHTHTVSTDEYTHTASTDIELPAGSLKPSNGLSKEDKKLWDIYRNLTYIQQFYILPPICVIGITGNILVAVAIYKTSEKSNSSYIYLFSHTIAHILSLLSDSLVPVSKLLGMLEGDQWQQISIEMYFWCQKFINSTFRNMAFNILCVMSIERVIAIKYPLKLTFSATVNHPYPFIFLSAIVGILPQVIVSVFIATKQVFDSNTNATKYVRANTDLYFRNEEINDKIMMIVKLLTGPLQIIFFCVTNAMILHGLFLNQKYLKTIKMNTITRLQNAKKLQVKMCKIFLVLCIVNILSNLPKSLTIIIATMFPALGMKVGSPVLVISAQAGYLLRIINSAFDFIILIVMSSKIRRRVKRYFVPGVTQSGTPECSTEVQTTEMSNT